MSGSVDRRFFFLDRHVYPEVESTLHDDKSWWSLGLLLVVYLFFTWGRTSITKRKNRCLSEEIAVSHAESERQKCATKDGKGLIELER